MHYQKFRIALGIVISLAAFGCGEKEPAEGPAGDSTEAAELVKEPAAEPIEEMTTSPADAAEESGVGEMATLEVTSAQFEHEAAIPLEYACDGAEVSPPLEWSAGPEGTQSYALIMDDPDAPRGTWVHWVVWNIPQPSLVDVIPAREKLDDGTMQGMNSWPKLGYGGPCPPSGTHRYFFKIYALDISLDLPSETTKEDLLRVMEGHILAQGELMGTYARVK